ncbi:hypothetical protein Cci01nite_53510 [Catellatospora citrea]|uniref:Uncharacterized protein n=1 Tax=Catellatospora citrea TaxID=53366 RepID=A0A8J3P1Q5_9ACTN|nr:hypothetical protein C8E86_6855 [Catellatospora citrea]GIG00258.1 hypothetical protein Cci01nite_53510 [Catellatospora citrea]
MHEPGVGADGHGVMLRGKLGRLADGVTVLDRDDRARPFQGSVLRTPDLVGCR